MMQEYVHFAEMYYNQYPKSWIHNALRSLTKNVRGKHREKTRVCENKATLPRFSPVGLYGPAEI